VKLTAAELAYVRSPGLYITEKCDGCGKLLNQSFRYTIMDKPEVYCSAKCRDLAFFEEECEAKRWANPRKCAYCGGSLSGKKRGALFCDDICRMRPDRVRERTGTRQGEKSRTPTESNQELKEAKIAR
jgi:hypothetical protein